VCGVPLVICHKLPLGDFHCQLPPLQALPTHRQFSDEFAEAKLTAQVGEIAIGDVRFKADISAG